MLKAVILEKMQDLSYNRYTLMSFVEHSSKWKLFTQCITSVLFPLGLYFNKRCCMVNQAVIQISFETIVIWNFYFLLYREKINGLVYKENIFRNSVIIYNVIFIRNKENEEISKYVLNLNSFSVSLCLYLISF